MSSSFSNLKFELIGTGEQSGSWGATTNSNIGTAIEQAIVGMATLTSSDFTANVATLTLSNTTAAQNARALCLVVSASSLSAAGTINVPAIQKPYLIINNDSYAVTVKVSGLTGVSVPAGKRTVVYNNGTDIGNQIDYLSTLALGTALPITSGGTGSTSTTFVNLATNVTGTLPVANGGTGSTTATGTGSVVLATSPTLVTPALGTPVSGNFSTGTFTWPTFNQNTSGTAAGLSSTLAVASGGTGLATTPANGQIDIGNGTGFTRTTLTAGSNITITNSAGGISIASTNPGGTVTGVTATAPVVSSGGTAPVISMGVASSSADGYLSSTDWSTFNNKQPAGSYITSGGALGTPSSGNLANCTFPTLNQNTTGTAAGLSATLAVASGGTGVTSSTGSGSVVLSNSPSLVTPALGTPSSGNLANCTFPTLNQNTSGTAAGLSATLAVTSGGTGVTTLTGLVKGSGTSAFTAATAGTDYVAPGTATTFTAKQTFSGGAATMAAKLSNALEVATISATAATGTINYDITTQSVLYYTSNASANWTVNFRASSGTSLNTAMATGESLTAVFMVTQGTTAYYNSAVTVDGVSVTPKWQGGSAPTSGNASGIDVYAYTIIKTGAATFTVLASVTQFK